MGKAKQKRFKVKQSPPTGLQSVKEFDTELEATAATNQTLQPIIEQLSSINEESRECACASIANLVSNPANISQILQNDCIKTLAPLFIDKSPQVCVKALGAIRNISVDGGIEACRLLVKKDVLTPLLALFSQFGVNWTPEQVTVKKLKDLKCEIFIEATNLLLNLCEATEEALKVFNKEGLVHVLWPCLQYKIYGYELSITVAQCLQTVTEDNSELGDICRLPDKCGLLESVIANQTCSSQHVLLKTLVVGILTNVWNDQLITQSNLLPVVVHSLSDVLKMNAVDILRSDILAQSQNAINGGDASNSEVKEKKTQKKKDTSATSNAENILKAQQVALETITNICCTDDDWEEIDSSESSSDEMSVDVQMEGSENISSPSDGISTEVENAITSNDIFNTVLQKIEPVDIVSMIQNTDGHADLLKSFERLQIFALLCCSNLVGSLDVSFLGGLENLHTVWIGLVKLASSPHVMKNMTMLEAVTSCMRAVVQKLADLQSPKLVEVTPHDLQFLYEMEQQCQQSDIKVNAVRIVSIIGCMFAKIPQPHPFLKDVGLFLLEICCKENDLWVVAESLDAMFDVFGEDHLDPIVREIQMVERLKSLLPGLKSQIQSKKKNLGEHYPVISTARINLIRFIKYKSQTS